MDHIDEADANESVNQTTKAAVNAQDVDHDQLTSVTSTLRRHLAAIFNTGLAIAGLVLGVISLHQKLTWPLAVGGGVMVITGFAINWLWGRERGVKTGIAIVSAAVVVVGAAGVTAAIALAHPRIISIHVRRISFISSPTVTLDEPAPGTWINPRPDISGALSGVTGDQYVWDLNQPFNLGRPQSTGDMLYPVERCSISASRSSFSCTQIFTGARADDYCRKVLIWIVVVSGAQNASLESRTANGNEVPYQVSWPIQPQHIGDGVAEVEVQRNPQAGKTCPSGL